MPAVTPLLDSPERLSSAGSDRGKVTLIGGGPGGDHAGDLMTVRAHHRLRTAEVVVHDRLSPTDVLANLAEGVELVDVGKRPGHHPVPQEQINALIVERALRGLNVVRLKGGDPFVFGRGGEEALACRALGIDVEVVPGISSAIAAPAAAGVPVTHRGIADAVHIVNGTHAPGEATLAALRDPTVTVVLLMGVGFFPTFADAALDAGVPGEIPVVFVENAHHSNQRTTSTVLADAAQALVEQTVKSPAVIVIGDVAALVDSGLNNLVSSGTEAGAHNQETAETGPR